MRPTILKTRFELQTRQDRLQVIEFAPGGRGGAADEVEQLAVLEAVIGEPLDSAVLVEINRNHPLVHDLLRHEGDRPLGALRNVVKYLAAHRRYGRGGSENYE